MTKGTPKGQKEGATTKSVVKENLTTGNDAQPVEESSKETSTVKENSTAETKQKEENTSKEKNNGMPFEIKDGLVTVISKTRAEKSITAKTGKVIQFDKDGKASVELEDALYLKECPGFEFK